MATARFSANLGYLFTDRPLPDAIAAAAGAGFDAVECHWPYRFPAREVVAALRDTGLSMVSLNTSGGRLDHGEVGLAALPGREREAREAIDQALDYAFSIGCGAVHLMAGRAGGPDALAVFRDNIAYAAEKAAPRGVTILLEAINGRDVPGYFVDGMDKAAEIAAATGLGNVKLMFDCYHQQAMRGDVLSHFERHLALVGHVQIASAPHRNEPDGGELDYSWLIPRMLQAGYEGFFGAEYRPLREGDFSWLARLRGA